MIQGRNPFFVAILAAFTLGTTAIAAEKVEIHAEVVKLSKKGTEIDPPKLAEMKKKFDSAGWAYTSFKRLSEQKLAIEQGKSDKLTLPNKRVAEISIDHVKDGVAQVSVHMPPLTKVQYQLGREGSLYIDGGWHEGGKLMLVLSPPAKK